MSLRYTRDVVLECDVDGTRKSFGHTNDMTARVLAQREGWQYAIYAAPASAGGRRFVVDICPGCDMPETLILFTNGEINAPAV